MLMKSAGWKKCICLLLCAAILAAFPAGVRAEGEDRESYLAYLTQQGFPVSYQEGLWQLHQRYPLWSFQPVTAALSWDEALAAESVLGVSLVSGTAASSWKSTQDGAYNWATSTWVTLDSGNWVAASREIIAYYMDPRNFLTESEIFQFLHQGFDAAAQTREGLTAMVSGTYLADTALDLDNDAANGVNTYIDTLYAAAETNGLSPYVLAAILWQEQGRTGASESISGANARYPGFYNYFNIGAYSAPGFTAVERGLWYASGGNSAATSYGRPWTTRSAAIAGGAAFYAANYLAAGQTTLYLKRFNVQGAAPCTHQYMTNVAGASAEGRTLASAYTAELRAGALTFAIPVFPAMPDTACPLPGGSGSVNAKLASLAVEGITLTPEFNRDIYEYTAVIPAETGSVNITATPCDATAALTGTGAAALQPGSNTLAVTVTASGGAVLTYTLLLSRQEAAAAQPPETPPTEMPAGAPAETPAPTPTAPPPAALRRGDVNGDGSIQINDLVRLRNHILGTATLTGDALAAGDVSGDGSILINDLILLRNHILGTATIQP